MCTGVEYSPDVTVNIWRCSIGNSLSCIVQRLLGKIPLIHKQGISGARSSAVETRYWVRPICGKSSLSKVENEGHVQ